jgi:hypothetical protein
LFVEVLADGVYGLLGVRAYIFRVGGGGCVEPFDQP